MAVIRKGLLLICLALSFGISACDKQRQAAEKDSSLPPTSLNFMFFGDKPSDMDKVLQEFENQTSQSLNMKLNMDWDAPEEFKQKVKLRLSSGEAIDGVFDGSWMSLESNVAQGYYRNLDRYFNNDEYPGLKKAFPVDFLNANKIDGHLFAVPLTQYFHDIEVIFIRKDLREQFGMSPIENYDELEQYLRKVKEQQPDMIPLALKGDRGFYRLFGNETKQVNARFDPTGISGTGIPFQIALSKDGKHVLGATTLGDPEEMYSGYPAPLNDPDFFYSSFDKFVEWNPFVQKDVLNERNPLLLFEAGKAAAAESTITLWSEVSQKLKTSVPGSELEGFVYVPCMRNMEKGCMGTNFKAWNNIAIPVTSKHADETMKFLDWLFSKQDNHDLFELGIEGEHWTKGEGLTYKSTSKSANYLFPPYELTWNLGMSRINVDIDKQILKLMQYSANPSSYYRLPVAGFVFNPAPVKTEIAKIQPMANQVEQVLNSGLDPNWRETARQTNEKLKGLGLDKIRAELIRQVQAYLDAGGN
ncbi:ABC transporter substrate-binding protein [Paenibacillus sp. JDR-2]|uniref:ABC transporter substrate-binding protein n=1 Tax=Paenibacillus sp. (strain JDR-2) TaxID=324057 RepID=UPI000166A2D8|nr:ABC transporter substrate-binding protein [Paenibacillus sp. JDR-2]ACT00649.1 ABC-type sugar transport system periplasmic component-like protein [Paenibacillus sp. JDR-2]